MCVCGERACGVAQASTKCRPRVCVFVPCCLSLHMPPMQRPQTLYRVYIHSFYGTFYGTLSAYSIASAWINCLQTSARPLFFKRVHRVHISAYISYLSCLHVVSSSRRRHRAGTAAAVQRSRSSSRRRGRAYAPQTHHFHQGGPRDWQAL